MPPTRLSAGRSHSMLWLGLQALEVDLGAQPAAEGGHGHLGVVAPTGEALVDPGLDAGTHRLEGAPRRPRFGPPPSSQLPSRCPSIAVILVAVRVPTHVTLFVFRVTSSHVSAHECLGDRGPYVGEITVPRQRLPGVRAGDRVRLRIAS
jgi:hypothetical protein